MLPLVTPAKAIQFSFNPPTLSSFDFGQVPVGDTASISTTYSATLALDPGCPCNGQFYINNFVLIFSEHAGLPSPFSIAGTNSVTLGFNTLDPVTLTLPITVQFTPTRVGNFTATTDALGNPLFLSAIVDIGASSPLPPRRRKH